MRAPLFRALLALVAVALIAAGALAAAGRASSGQYAYDPDGLNAPLVVPTANDSWAGLADLELGDSLSDGFRGYDDHLQLARASARPDGYRLAPRATLSGRTVLGDTWDDAIRAGRRARPETGFHDVVAHGTPTGIYDAAGNLLSPADAAAVIRGTPSWGGQNIRSLSCSTGCPTGNFAQGLANELGAAVRAPTVDFYVNSRGIPVLDPGGRWLTYMPGGG